MSRRAEEAPTPQAGSGSGSESGPGPGSATEPASLKAAPDFRANVSRVAAVLRERIARSTLAPGARLREWEVAAEFGISRLSAREALDTLLHMGFVDRQPNRGIVVRRFDLDALRELYDLREVNEGLCARLAAQKAAPESWEPLIALFGAPMEEVVRRADLDAYSANYARMQRGLVDAAGSPLLADLLGRLYDMTSTVGRRVLVISDRTRYGLRDHRSVLAALRAGDAEAAERLRRATIANIKEAVERYYTFIA